MGIIDCHCDVISRIWHYKESIYCNQGQFDVQRARSVGVEIQFCALFATPNQEATLRTILNQIDKFKQELVQYPKDIYMITSDGDINQNRGQGKLGCLLHLEGGEALGSDPGLLRIFYHLGLRSIGLTWNFRNLLADGVMEVASQGGLSSRGQEVVRLAQAMGMVIDLAHISPRGFFDVMGIATGPVMVSHANARRRCDHPRNLTDEQLKSLASNGGIVGCTLVPCFIAEKEAGFNDFIDHIAYISDLIGVEHVAIGSDFDGVDDPVLKDVSEYIHLRPALQERGFSEDEIRKILEENCRGFLQKVLPAE